MGTPRKMFTVCGLDSCSSTKALLDTGADLTLLSGDFARHLGTLTLDEPIFMKSATGQSFSVQQAIVFGHLDGECEGPIVVGITEKKNLGGENAIIGNDMMGQKCMKIEFDPEKCGVSQLVRVGCDCHHFFIK
jgi:predicted aspartyl protease